MGRGRRSVRLCRIIGGGGGDKNGRQLRDIWHDRPVMFMRRVAKTHGMGNGTALNDKEQRGEQHKRGAI